MKRTKYTTEFKLEAVKQILEKGHSATDVASRLGVPVGLLYTWTRKLKGLDEKPIEDVKALQAEMTKLKAELRRTTEERDILKKAAVSSTRQCNTFGLIPIKGGVVWRKWVDQVFLLHKNTIYGTDGV